MRLAHLTWPFVKLSVLLSALGHTMHASEKTGHDLPSPRLVNRTAGRRRAAGATEMARWPGPLCLAHSLPLTVGEA